MSAFAQATTERKCRHYVLYLILVHLLYYVKTWRRPQSQTHTCIALPIEEPRTHATCAENLVKFVPVVFEICSVVRYESRQRNRQRSIRCNTGSMRIPRHHALSKREKVKGRGKGRVGREEGKAERRKRREEDEKMSFPENRDFYQISQLWSTRPIPDLGQILHVSAGKWCTLLCQISS